MKRFIATLMVVAFAFGGTALAQGGPPCDTGGAVAFTVNGSGPDGAGQVIVAPGSSAALDFSDGDTGAPLIILGTLGGIACGAIPTPWGGSVDLGAFGLAVVADGVGGTVGPLDAFATTDFTLTASIPCAAAGLTGIAFQGLHIANSPPFNLDNTVAIELVFPASVATNLITNGSTFPDDGFFSYAVDPCNSISFYGQEYDTLFVGSNGQVTFGQGSGDFSVTAADFFGGFATGAVTPGVAVMWGDYNRVGVNGDYIIDEDPGAGTTKVTFSNQSWWDSNTGPGTAGTFSVEFGSVGAGSLTLDHTAALAGVGGVDQDPYVGVTNGDAVLGTQSDPTGALLGYASPGIDDSVGHQYPLSGSDPLDPLTNFVSIWVDVGGGTWTVF